MLPSRITPPNLLVMEPFCKKLMGSQEAKEHMITKPLLDIVILKWTILRSVMVIYSFESGIINIDRRHSFVYKMPLFFSILTTTLEPRQINVLWIRMEEFLQNRSRLR